MKPINVTKKTKKFIQPTPAQVVEYFEFQKKTAKEAMKFFFYYSSIDWYVGKKKMRSWRAAASGWVLRMGDFAPSNSEAVILMKVTEKTPQILEEEAQIKRAYAAQKKSY